MKTDPKLSRQVQAHAHLHAGFASPGAASMASRTRYTCMMHPETVREAPEECPECGATLIPMHQALARAAIALRSLSAVTKALRLHQV